MSTKAQSVLEQIKDLPRPDQEEVCRQVVRLLAHATPPVPVNDPIRSARGMFAGSRLNAALLASRTEERRRG